MFLLIVALIMILLFGGLNFYIAKRIHKGIASRFRKFPFWGVFIVLIIPTVISLSGFFTSGLGLPTWLKSFLSTVFAYWMGFFVYLLLFTIIIDFVTLILKLFKAPILKKTAFRLTSACLILILTLSTGIYGICHARDIQHISYEIEVEGKRDVSDLNIVLISDLHLGAMGSESRLEEIVGEINSLNPDVVCIAGDLFDTNFNSIENPETAAEKLKKISSTYGVYACLGNHDAGETYPKMAAFLKKCNVIALNDDYVTIDDRLVLVGRLDGTPIGGYGNISRKKFDEFFVMEDKTRPIIVMDHNPANIDEYGNKADLIVSGHTHKGQIFPANIITDLIYDVDHGYYRKDANNPHVIVTSGVGYWGMPMRVGTDSEIVSIKIKH